MRNPIAVVVRDKDQRPRLIWRLFLYFLCYLVTAMFSTYGFSAVRRMRVPVEIAFLFASVVNIGALLGFTLLLRRKVDRREWSGMALQSIKEGLIRFLGGAVLGLIMVSLVLAVIYLSGCLEFLPFKGPGAYALFVGLFNRLVSFIAVGFT